MSEETIQQGPSAPVSNSVPLVAPTVDASNDRPGTPVKDTPAVNYAEDTPNIVRQSHSNDYRSGELGTRRAIQAFDSCTVDVVTQDYFFDHVLPRTSESVRIEDIIDDLRLAGWLKGVNLEGEEGGVEGDGRYEGEGEDEDEGGEDEGEDEDESEDEVEGEGEVGAAEKLSWTCFQDRSLREDVFFAPLEHICQSVVASVERRTTLRATHTLQMKPDETLFSERNEQMRPDGYFLREGMAPLPAGIEKAPWYDISLCVELKKQDTKKEKNDNTLKVLYGMQHILGVDACRRFTYGLTIEKETMSIWHASRSALLKCNLNFYEDPRRLVEMLVAFSFAEPCEYGWDDTVEAFWAGHLRQYRFKVDDKVYETRKLLAEFSTDAIVCRGTRVFKVVDKSTGVEYVLKDFWNDADRKKESEIVEEMLADIEALPHNHSICPGRSPVDVVRNHIVNIEKDVYVKAGGMDDHTRDTILHGELPVTVKREKLIADPTRRGHYYASVGGLQSTDYRGDAPTRLLLPFGAPTKKAEHKIRVKRHCRVVYREVGVPISSVKKLSRAIVVLDALYFIHKAGWVHRDISIGNIYEFDGRGLLADFEYAKKMGTEAEHEVKTGTLNYMASEAVLRLYTYVKKKEKTRAFPFFHNGLHDMESVIWVTFAILLNVVPNSSGIRNAIIYEIFSGCEDRIAWRQSFMDKECPATFLFEDLLGKDRAELLERTMSLRDILINFYRSVGPAISSKTFGPHTFHGIHADFCEVWKDCMEHLRSSDVDIDTSLEISHVQKRQADEDGGDQKKRLRQDECIDEEDEGRS